MGWNIGQVVTLKSAFSVPKGMVAMRKTQEFGQALIKPRGEGWPLLVPGKYIYELFSTK